jgi:hypothetical protein
MKSNLLALVVAGALVIPQWAAAQETVDLSGTWDRPGTAKESPGGAGLNQTAQERLGILPRQVFTAEEPPMQPWAAEKFRIAREGKDDLYEDGRDELDPSYNCFPPGTPRVFTIPRPFEIHQLPKVVLMLFETANAVRRIHTDGREHPDGYPITWMGHSIGRYERDALVVDTVGLDDRTWLDALGHPHSDALRVEERFTRPNRNTLQIDFVFDDPKAYTRPWTGKKVYELMPPGFNVMEDFGCDDQLKLGIERY